MNLIFFTGDIRNLREIGKMLMLPDSEISLKGVLETGYDRIGAALFVMLNGRFSFVLQDPDSGTAVAVRDRFGACSLYYAVQSDGSAAFSDSIGKLLETTGMRRTFREELLDIYFAYSYLPGEETFYSGIFKVMPGHYVLFDGEISKERYFTPRYQPDISVDHVEWVCRLRRTLQTVLDEYPKGGASLLSSGVDSSLLAAALKAKDTYTADYGEASFSESDIAAGYSRRISSLHHRLPISPENYLHSVGAAMTALDQPSGDASAEVLYLSCREISNRYDSCLSGEGIDEMFFGYYLTDIVNKPEDKTLQELMYIGSTNIMTDAEIQRILRRPMTEDRMRYCREAYALTANQPPLYQGGMLDLLIWLEGNLLRNIEKLGFSCGVNLVTPYLDNRLYDLALRIPAEAQHGTTETKRIFRAAAEAVIGREAAFRPKRGFPVPIRLWLRTDVFIGEIRRAFTSGTAEQFFNTQELLRLYERYIRDTEDCWYWRSIWAAYCFIIWYDVHFAPENRKE